MTQAALAVSLQEQASIPCFGIRYLPRISTVRAGNRLGDCVQEQLLRMVSSRWTAHTLCTCAESDTYCQQVLSHVSVASISFLVLRQFISLWFSNLYRNLVNCASVSFQSIGDRTAVSERTSRALALFLRLTQPVQRQLTPDSRIDVFNAFVYTLRDTPNVSMASMY